MVRNAFRSTFRSLRIRNFRLFYVGQIVSLCGSWVQTVALGWYVYARTHSGTQVGLVTAVQFLPTMVGGAWGGLIADRLDKRRTLIATQSWQAVVAAGLAAVVLGGVARMWMIYLFALAQGMATMVDNPTRQTFITEMVGRDSLANALGLNSAMFNAARVIGPAIAGVLLETSGAGVCFAANAVSFLAVIAGLAAMNPSELHRGAPVRRAKGQLREGFRYARREPTVRLVLGMMALVGTLTMNFQVVLPVLAKAVFSGRAGTYGAMTAVMGGGSFLGALLVAGRARPTPRLLVGAAVCAGMLMLGDALAPTLGLELVTLFVTGGAVITFMSTANASVQLSSTPEMRGRVMSLYMVLFLGSTPIGGPVLGWIAQHWGARWSLAVGGMAAGAAAAWASWRLARTRGRPRPAITEPAAVVVSPVDVATA